MAVAALQEAGWGPRGWSRSPEGVGLLPGKMPVSTLVGGRRGLRGCSCSSETALHVSV